MSDKLRTYSLTVNIKVIDAIREKWDVPPEAGKEVDWWETDGKKNCALCMHMTYFAKLCKFCPIKDEGFICCKEFNGVYNYMGGLLEAKDLIREEVLELFTAMRERIFALKPEDIPCITDSDAKGDE